MANYLEDGSVMPSCYTPIEIEAKGYSVGEQLSENLSIKQGYVIAVHAPTDKGYQDFNELVYDVVTPTSHKNGGVTWQHFRSARWAGGIGGTTNDFTDVKLTFPSEPWTPNTPISEALLRQCSAVNILCVNGQSNNGIIVGFSKHPYRTVSLSLSDGYQHRWDFNGMSSIIDKDGQYKVTFTGAILDPQTNKYIEPPAETTGTFFQFSKEGNWLVDNSKGESILLDKKNKLANIQAREMKIGVTEKDLSVNVKGKMVFKSDGNAVLNGKKNYIGKEGATEPLVLGKKLTTALQKLVQALITPPIGVLGSAPIMPSPALVAGLNQWMAQYASPASPFLSKKGFVE